MSEVNVAQTVERLRSLAERFPADERPAFMPGSMATDITAMEQCLRSPLPDDFADFLRKCEAIHAMDVWNGYWIGGIAELMRSISRGDFPGLVANGDRPVPVVPVATDGGGNAFLLSLDGRTVWKRDHETASVQSVAAGFMGFLLRVEEDWEHYLRRDYDWQYLAG